MDLALAHLVEARLSAADGQDAKSMRLSAGRLSQLLERCRTAKEQLLAADAPDKTSVTLLGAGSSLVGGARSVELTRNDVERIIADGFFPMVAATEQAQQRRSGIVEFGLPYAADPAISRHLASFLAQHAPAARAALGELAPDEGTLAVPDTLLLNGGVFRAPILAQRLENTVSTWRGKPLRLLHNENPDVAVARGAVSYSRALEGFAPKIGGGSPRSYFLVLDDRARGYRKLDKADADQPAATSASASRRGICILPRGSEQGSELLLADRIFALRLGQPVRFHLVSSTTDEVSVQPSRLGDLADLDNGDFVALPPIATALRTTEGKDRKQDVPVRLATSLTEVGTLEMHCVSATDPNQRWLLEFQLREDDGASGGATANASEPELPPRFTDAIAKIDRIFGTRAQKVMPKEVKQLRTQLEQVLGRRERWHTPLLRHLFDALWHRAPARKRSADHERVWFNLAGYCLRPGFGYPLDDWRIDQLWSIFDAGVYHGKDSQVAVEWWTMWRRVAGGMNKDRQLRLLDDFAFNVQEDEAERQQHQSHLVKGSDDDMLRLVASLERIPADYKAEIGEWLLGRITKSVSSPLTVTPSDNLALWTIARLGARQPFYGSAHDVVAPDVVAGWLDAILALDWKRVDAAPAAAAHLARLTGDRARDLPIELRDRIILRLTAIGAAPAWIAMVRETVQLDEASQRNFLGDSLPPGLKLID